MEKLQLYRHSTFW